MKSKKSQGSRSVGLQGRRFTAEQKERALLLVATRGMTREAIAATVGTTREAIAALGGGRVSDGLEADGAGRGPGRAPAHRRHRVVAIAIACCSALRLLL